MQIFSFSFFILLAWILFSFLFWKSLRSQAVEEEAIFDFMFAGTIAALIGARIGYILQNAALFQENLLLMVTPWVAPGLSFYGAFVACIATLLVLSRQKHVRVGMVLDGLAFSLPAAVAVGEIGSLLDGSTIGKTTGSWGILYAGHLGRRHPVQVYEFIALFAVMVFVLHVQKLAKVKKLPYGVIGIWFFLAFSAVMFFLESFRETHVYWMSLTVNQWILLAIFAEAIGALYVRGGGREVIRPRVTRMIRNVSHVPKTLYERISKRRS
jgi:prolipoprotein diacylglyceryltransferase